MIAPPVHYRLTWTEPLLREVSGILRTTGKTGKRRNVWLYLLAWALIGLALAATPALLDLRAPKSLLWFGLGMVAGAWLIVLVSSVSATGWRRRELASPIRQAVNAITLSDDGIRIVHPLSEATFDWRSILSVREGRLALHLMLSATQSLPLPDTGLPDGMTREDLLRRIEAWRTAA